MKAFARFASVLAIGAGSSAAMADVFSNYEDLSEGFKGEPFGPNDNGRENIIERAVPFYNDFPDYGSPVNTMTFGSSFVVGDNLSIGALASVWMDMPSLSNAASFDIGFYENGPWGGVQWRLEALRNGAVVGSDTIT